MGRRAMILGAAPSDAGFIRDLAKTGDYLICADGGCRAALAAGLKPDLIVGDFDSLTPEEMGCFPGVERVTHPVQKDDTDTMLAIKYAINRGCGSIVIAGCFGGRLDHTIANIQSVVYGIIHGIDVILKDPDNELFAAANGQRRIPNPGNAYVSFFAYSDVCEGVTLEGFFYPLTDAVVTNSFPIGVSNELVAAEGIVSVRRGILLGVISKKEPSL